MPSAFTLKRFDLASNLINYQLSTDLSRFVHSTLKRHRETQASLTNGASARNNPNSVNGHHNHHHGSNAHGGADTAEERRMSLVLVFIVVLFLLCNVPRITLNTYEVLSVATFQANVHNPCYVLPSWVTLTAVLSLVLISLNSAIDFFVYCFVNATFRAEFVAFVASKVCKAGKNRNNNNGKGGGNGDRKRLTTAKSEEALATTHV